MTGQISGYRTHVGKFIYGVKMKKNLHLRLSHQCRSPIHQQLSRKFSGNRTEKTSRYHWHISRKYELMFSFSWKYFDRTLKLIFITFRMPSSAVFSWKEEYWSTQDVTIAHAAHFTPPFLSPAEQKEVKNSSINSFISTQNLLKLHK